jgi:hypothetical protein
LATCFPVDNADVDLGDITAYRTISFVLRRAQETCDDPVLRGSLARRVDELERGAVIAYELLHKKPISYLVSAHLLAPLKAQQSVLIPAGFFKLDGERPDGHSVALYFAPNPTGTTRVAICNRGSGRHPYHWRDWRRRRIPILWECPTSDLSSARAQPILQEIFSLQRPAAGNDLDAFYDAMQRLMDACNGTLLCGKDGDEHVHTVPLAAQGTQKGGTCSWHSAWGWLDVALQLDLCATAKPPVPKRKVRNLYKALKREGRAVIVKSAVQALHAQPAGASTQALKMQLVKARQWLVRHLFYDPALLPIYSDVFFALKKV